MKRNREKYTVWYCEFCTAEFATFIRFPIDVRPYCTNCGNDEDIIEVDNCYLVLNKEIHGAHNVTVSIEDKKKDYRNW